MSLSIVDKQIQNHLNRREFKQAYELIQNKLKQEPENADSHYLLGVYYYFQGNIKNTIAHLKKALDIDPKHTDTAICLSVLYNDLGQYDEAKYIFEKANYSVSQDPKHDSIDLGIDKKFAVKHLELADLYMRYRRFDEAIDEYSKAAVLDPLTLDIRIKRAKAYSKKGLTTRAIQELQQMKTENPRFLPARIQLGLFYYSQGNVLDAELEWETVLEMDSSNREAASYLEMAKQNRMKTQIS